MVKGTRSTEDRYFAAQERIAELEDKLTELASRMTNERRDFCLAPDCRTESIITDPPLCALHLNRAWVEFDKWTTNRLRGLNTEWSALGMGRDNPAVYYIRMNKQIKIGFTTSLISRMEAFCALPQDLLALEPGGRVREHERHVLFAHLRVPRTERFNEDDELLGHIHQLRRTYGDPVKHLASISGRHRQQ